MTVATRSKPSPARSPVHSHSHAHSQSRKAVGSGTACEECLCTICTCGHHQCPPTAQSTHYSAQLQSTSHAGHAGLQPTRHFGANSHSLVLDQHGGSPTAFDSVTNYQADYVAHSGLNPIKRLKGMQQAPSLESSTLFRGESTKQHDYTQHALQKQTGDGKKHLRDKVSPIARQRTQAK